jgi:hypothetical protein
MRALLILSFLPISWTSFCQKSFLFESREYKTSYESGTRSRKGIPGENYWQNYSQYDIKAEFDPKTHLITGHLSVKYFNQSPDSLHSIVLKLMQNVYKKGAVRQMEVDTQNLHDGVQITNVKYNGVDIPDPMISYSGTVMTISLSKNLKQNSNGAIELDFITPVPVSSGFRGGTVDSTSFFMAYWFPQIAVYDDVFGWDKDEYVGIPENYNDFSDYSVEITLPSEYNIWATGEHMNMQDIFTREVLDRIEKSKSSENPVTLIDEKDFRKADDHKHTWKFEAKKVPDFAWGASDHYIWEGMAAKNPDASNLCWVQTAYMKDDPNFNWVLGVAKNSVEVFSGDFPGVPYPYFKHISFSGTEGGGMEFPMLANNDATPDSISTILVTAHELAHNYYPFMMGINERKYGWWDETMTTLMESYIHEKLYHHLAVRGFFNRRMSFPYFASSPDILPLMTETSSMMKVMPSIINFYIKGPAIMDILENVLGAKVFMAINKEFMHIWAGKHPTPYDFYYFVNHKTGKNLSWLWDACFFSQGYPDLAIEKASQNGQFIAAIIKNQGGLPVPFQLTITYENGNETDEEFNVEVWRDNLEYQTVRIPVTDRVEKIQLNESFFYDTNPANDEYFMNP